MDNILINDHLTIHSWHAYVLNIAVCDYIMLYPPFWGKFIYLFIALQINLHMMRTEYSTIKQINKKYMIWRSAGNKYQLP